MPKNTFLGVVLILRLLNAAVRTTKETPPFCTIINAIANAINQNMQSTPLQQNIHFMHDEHAPLQL